MVCNIGKQEVTNMVKLAEWVNVKGKVKATLFGFSDGSYKYSYDGGGGVFYANGSDIDAFNYVQKLSDCGILQDDNAKTKLKAIWVKGDL